MSLKSLICMESCYFHVYVVSCDVHFRYSDDACWQRNTKSSSKYETEAARSWLDTHFQRIHTTHNDTSRPDGHPNAITWPSQMYIYIYIWFGYRRVAKQSPPDNPGLGSELSRLWWYTCTHGTEQLSKRPLVCGDVLHNVCYSYQMLMK